MRARTAHLLYQVYLILSHMLVLELQALRLRLQPTGNSWRLFRRSYDTEETEKLKHTCSNANNVGDFAELLQPTLL